VQIRYRRVPQPATVRRIDERSVSVQFDDPELAVTPGQAAVFYDGDEVLGGGFIADSSTTLATTWAAEAAPAP
jgi:tRNA-specific 2-thiouridylase